MRIIHDRSQFNGYSGFNCAVVLLRITYINTFITNVVCCNRLAIYNTHQNRWEIVSKSYMESVINNYPILQNWLPE